MLRSYRNQLIGLQNYILQYSKWYVIGLNDNKFFKKIK